jgi:OFA family oxalate/formate antiporter-like MFS transporter
MFLLGTFAATIFLVHAAPIAASYGMSPVLAAEAVGVFGAGSLSSRILLGAVSDYLDRTRSVVLAFLSELAGLALVAMIRSNETVFIFAGFAIGFGYGGFLSDFISLVGDLFGRTSMERIWAVQETAYGMGGLLGPISAGIYFDSTGNYFGILLVSTILVGLALFISIGFSVSYRHAETLRLS